MAKENPRETLKETRARKKAEKVKSTLDFNSIFGNMATKIEDMTNTEYKNKATLYTLIATTLITASSLLYIFNIQSTWLPGFIGAPSGILLFWLGYSLTLRTRIGEWEIWDKREEFSFKKRLATTGWVALIGLIIIFALFPHVPYLYGIGGAIFVASLITIACYLRKTPYELELDEEGLPDPRDLSEFDLEEYDFEDEDGEVQKLIGGDI